MLDHTTSEMSKRALKLMFYKILIFLIVSKIPLEVSCVSHPRGMSPTQTRPMLHAKIIPVSDIVCYLETREKCRLGPLGQGSRVIAWKNHQILGRDS